MHACTHAYIHMPMPMPMPVPMPIHIPIFIVAGENNGVGGVGDIIKIMFGSWGR